MPAGKYVSRYQLGFITCTHVDPSQGNLMYFTECPEDNPGRISIQAALDYMETKAPSYYAYFKEWVKGVSYDDTNTMFDVTKSCYVEAFVTCMPYIVGKKPAVVAAYLIYAAAGNEKSSEEYATQKMNEFLTAMGEAIILQAKLR